jgi:hypothetical protein
MAADDKCPPWIRVSTHDMTSAAGRYIIGGGSPKEWADYGRFFALLQLQACTADGRIDVADDRRLRSLARDLGMTPKACRDWLQMLAEGGAIDLESLEAGHVVNADVWEFVQSYQTQARVNRKNGARGGRPSKTKPTT